MSKILVVVDVQNDFITGSLNNVEAQKKIENIVKKIKSEKWKHIYVTKDTHQENYLQTKEGQSLPIPHCIVDSKGWEIEPKVQEALDSLGEKVSYFTKPTFGSDSLRTSIVLDFHKFGPSDIEIIGFCTDICVITNALLLKTAFYNEVDITVDSKCCAGVTPEKHKAALEVMKSCQIIVK